MNESSRTAKFFGGLAQAIVPIIVALVIGGLIIWAMGKDPLAFYAGVWKYGITGENWQSSLKMLAPLLIIGLALVLVFRGGIWNLGYGGQYLLGAVVASGFGPILFPIMPTWLATIVIVLGSVLIGALWTLIPSILKAKYGTNEIITSLVMSFIAVGIVNMLIKGPFRTPNLGSQPQTVRIESEYLLPYIPGTKIHIGFLVALVLVLVGAYLLRRTSWGLRLDVFGASPKSAQHIGINKTWMVVLLFAISGALIGLAGAIDVLGDLRIQRANWDPHYGEAVMPFVFLARLSPIAMIPLLFFYSVLATGGVFAAQQAGLDVDFMMVIVGLILLFMTVTEFVAERRRLGQGYLPPELRATLVQPFKRLGKLGRAVQ